MKYDKSLFLQSTNHSKFCLKKLEKFMAMLED